VPHIPGLHERDERGRRLPPTPGALPSFHSFRHTAASHAIAAGESAEEVSWQLGRRDSVVTRAVYIHELKTGQRTAHRRQRMDAESAWFLSSMGTR
jgi:integrase